LLEGGVASGSAAVASPARVSLAVLWAGPRACGLLRILPLRLAAPRSPAYRPTVKRLLIPHMIIRNQGERVRMGPS
jgi:hypothetical protein